MANSLEELLVEMQKQQQQGAKQPPIGGAMQTLGDLFDKHIKERESKDDDEFTFELCYQDGDGHDTTEIEANYWNRNQDVVNFYKNGKITFMIPFSKVIFINRME